MGITDTEKSSDGCAAAIGVFCAALLALVVRGFVFMRLWSWFAVPVFGVREFGISISIGLLLAARSVLGFREFKKPDDNSGETITRLVAESLAMLFLLILGGAIHHWATP